MSEATACGKVILFGEHAVVYGVPALAVGIDRGARAEIAPGQSDASTLLVRGWNITVREGDAETALARAFGDLLAATRADLLGPSGGRPSGRTSGALAATVDVAAEADLPPGGGLGCSAALGVAVARALDPEASPLTVARRVDAWERVFHGNPSGIDAAVSALGGCVWFERREGAPSIRPVIAPSPLRLVVGHTGQASSTKTMVDAVARLAVRRPHVTGRAFAAIGTLVSNARLAIEAGDLGAIGQLLDLNQMLLAGLFVSTPEIEQMCAAARAAGALGAKLTGAGGGGSVVALVERREDGDAVLEAWKAEGFSGFFATAFAEAAPRAPELAPVAALGGVP